MKKSNTQLAQAMNKKKSVIKGLLTFSIYNTFDQKLAIVLGSLVLGFNLAFITQMIATSMVEVKFMVGYAVVLLLLSIVEDVWNKQVLKKIRYSIISSMLGMGCELLVRISETWIFAIDLAILLFIVMVFVFAKTGEKQTEDYDNI